MTGVLECAGYSMTDSEEADLVIYNTCTVRDNANQRVYGRLGFLNSLKKEKPANENCPMRLYDAGKERN